MVITGSLSEKFPQGVNTMREMNFAAGCILLCLAGCGNGDESKTNSSNETEDAGVWYLEEIDAASEPAHEISSKDAGPDESSIEEQPDAAHESEAPRRVWKYKDELLDNNYFYDSKYKFFGFFQLSDGEYKLVPTYMPYYYIGSASNLSEYSYYYDSDCLWKLDWFGTKSNSYDVYFDLWDLIKSDHRSRNLLKSGDRYCSVNPSAARKVYQKYERTGACNETTYIGFLNSDMFDCFEENDLASYVPVFVSEPFL